MTSALYTCSTDQSLDQKRAGSVVPETEMNRVLLICLVVAAAAFLGDALPRSSNSIDSWIKNYVSSQREAVNSVLRTTDGMRYRRQSAACMGDLAELGEEPYSTCLAQMGAVFPGSSDFSVNVIVAYCGGDCPADLKNLFDAIVRDCGSEEAPDVNLLHLIYAACDRDPKGQFCAIDYNQGINTTQYENCVNEYDGGKGCTSDCHKMVDFLSSNFGCCYTDLFDFEYYDEGYGDKLVNDKVFEACGSTFPDPC